MDTYRLRYFCTIAETGSLTKAAEILGVSHSGLSKAISALQTETKLQLFRPQGRGLEITENGKWFYKKALEILKIENEFFLQSQPEQAIIRFGMPEVLAVTCATAISEEFTEALAILESDVGETELKLLNSEIDFGFTFSPIPRIELEYFELGTVKFNAYARADLTKSKKAGETPYSVPASQIAFNPQGYKVRDGWPQSLLRITPFYVSGFAIALNLLRSGKCAVYMPDFIATMENEIINVKNPIIKVPGHLEAHTKRKLYLVKEKSQEESKSMKKISKILRKLCCQ